MRLRGSRIRQLVGTLATVGVVLACAPAAQADHLTPSHHYSFSAKSARTNGGNLVLTGVESTGLLTHPRRHKNAKLTVRELVRQWEHLGSKPYLAGTHSRGLMRLHPRGKPTYDPKRHRLTIPVSERGSSTKLGNTRWVVTSHQRAAENLVAQSYTVGGFQFVTTYAADSYQVNVTVVAGGSIISTETLTAVNPMASFSFGGLGPGSIEAQLSFTPPTPIFTGRLFLSAQWSSSDGTRGVFNGPIASFG